MAVATCLQEAQKSLSRAIMRSYINYRQPLYRSHSVLSTNPGQAANKILLISVTHLFPKL